MDIKSSHSANRLKANHSKSEPKAQETPTQSDPDVIEIHWSDEKTIVDPKNWTGSLIS